MKFFASLLIIAAILNPLAGTKRAYASPDTGGDGQVAFDFALDLPGGGALDRFHNPFTKTDHVSNSLYALRNVAIEDLLNTRKALKILLGGTERARKISQDPSLTFGVPDSVLALYLTGTMGVTDWSTEDFKPKDYTSLPERSVGNSFQTDLDHAVQWLDSTDEAKYDEALRNRLAAGLLYVTGLLARYDQHLKFYQQDFWTGPVYDEFYFGQVMPTLGAPDSMTEVTQAVESAKQQWLTDHKMDEPLALLAGHREFLLNRYHILAIDVGGKPLYAHLYEALRKEAGFPDPKMVQAPVEPRLPGGNDPIPMPDGFDKKLDAAFDSLAQDATSGKRVMNAILSRVNPKIDQALLASLEANTNRLSKLTSEQSFQKTDQSPLLDLALYPEVWEGARVKYSYLEGVIDFDQAKKKLDSFFKARDKQRKIKRYVAYGAGIGLGVVAIVASAGTAGTFLGIGARAYLVGSGLVTAAQATTDYIDHKMTAEIERNLFFGSARIGDYEAMKNAVLIAESDYRAMISAIVMLGFDLGTLSVVAKARNIVVAGGRRFVQLSKTELKALQSQVTKLATRAEALAPLGRAMLSSARFILGMTKATRVVKPLGEAAEIVAKQLKMTKAAVITKLEQNRFVGKFITDYRDIVKMEPKFMRMLLREQVTSFGIGLTSEVLGRGSKFKDELGYVAFDLLTGAGMSAHMVFLVGRNSMRAEKLALQGIRRPKTVFDGGFSIAERGKFFAENFKDFALVGLSWNLAGQSVMEGIEEWKDPDKESFGDHVADIFKMGAFGGVFMGVSSNMRYQFMGYASDRLGKLVAKQRNAELVITGLSVANQLFGGWHWVKLAKHWGIQGEDGKFTPMDAFSATGELVSNPKGLMIDQTQNALLKLEADDDAVGYVYDFLREGDDAGEAPILY